MLRPSELRCLLTSTTLVLLSATASAQNLEMSLSLAPVDEQQVISPLSGNNGRTMAGASAPLDYATFVSELLAFVTKEVLSDSGEEYPESPIGSRLSRSMLEQRSQFGGHCLTVLARLGSAVPYRSAGDVEFAAGPTLPLGYLARAAAAALALRRILPAFESGAGDDRRAVSLNPKVGMNKVRISLTIHW